MQATLTTATGGAVSVPSTLNLDEAVPGPPPRFRKTFRFRFTTAGADRVHIRRDAVRLDGAFLVRDVVVRGTDVAPEAQATVTASGGALRVTLKSPARVRRVRIQAASGQTAGGIRVQLFRMDGDVAAKEHTHDVGNDVDIATPDFTDRRFALRATHAGSAFNLTTTRLERLEVRGYPTGARLGLMFPDDTEPTLVHSIPGEAGRGGQSPSGAFPAGEVDNALADALQRGLDGLPRPLAATVDVLLVAESDAPCRLRLDHVAVPFDLVRDTFRVALLRPADLSSPATLLTRLREASDPVSAFIRSLLNPTLRDTIDRATGGAAPAALVSALVADLNRILQIAALYQPDRFADVPLTPELLNLAAAAPTGTARTRLNRQLLNAAFPEIQPLPDPAAEEKQVLRHEDRPLQVEVDLPRLAQVRTATLRVSASLRNPIAPPGAENGGEGGEGGEGGGQTPPDDPPAGSRGATLDGETVAAVRLAPQAPLAVHGLALALVPTAPRTEIIADVRQEAGGRPGGQVLATVRLALGAIDLPAWVNAGFPGPLTLTSDPHWIVARAVQGGAVWLADEGEDDTSIGDATPDGRGWKDRDRLRGLAARFRLGTATAPPPRPVAGSDPTTAPATPATDPGFRLVLGGRTVRPQPADDDTFTVSLTDPLRDHLQGAGAEGTDLVVVPLRFTTSAAGLLTVYPPAVHYDLQV
jgi:hypothetical protein